MTKTFVIFEQDTMRAIGFASVDESLIDLVLQPGQLAAPYDGVFEPAASYAIVDGKAVKQ